jgi:transcriptional regulator with XRE-family HTH domain
MSSKKHIPSTSEASRRISALRKALGLSQEEFAARLGVGRIAALYWESGRSQPSADTYVRMANVAKEVDFSSAVWFWQQVGVDRDTLRDLVPEFNKSDREAEQRVRDITEHATSRIVAVPLLREIANIDAPTLASEDQIEAWLPLPAVLVPNPTHTSCLRGPVGMTVLGEELVVIDSSEFPLEQLWGRMVIAAHQSSRESYAGFLQHFNSDNRRIPALSTTKLNEFYFLNHITEIDDPAKTARKQGKPGKKTGSNVLLTPGTFLPMTPKREWKILGRVICWISSEQGRDLVRPSKGNSSSSGIESGS